MLEFLVEGGGFGDGRSGVAIFFVFFGGRPVDQGGGKFFPLVALGAHVADAVALHFILGDELIGAVFEDEAAGEFLGVGGEGEQERRGGR